MKLAYLRMLQTYLHEPNWVDAFSSLATFVQGPLQGLEFVEAIFYCYILEYRHVFK